jgi:hypothetical protein
MPARRRVAAAIPSLTTSIENAPLDRPTRTSTWVGWACLAALRTASMSTD